MSWRSALDAVSLDNQLGTLSSASESDEDSCLLLSRNTPPLTQISTSVLPPKTAANKTVEEASNLSKELRETPILLEEDTLDYLVDQLQNLPRQSLQDLSYTYSKVDREKAIEDQFFEIQRLSLDSAAGKRSKLCSAELDTSRFRSLRAGSSLEHKEEKRRNHSGAKLLDLTAKRNTAKNKMDNFKDLPDLDSMSAEMNDPKNFRNLSTILLPELDPALKVSPVEGKDDGETPEVGVYPGTPTTEEDESCSESSDGQLLTAVRSYVESAVQETPLRQGEFSLGPQLKGAKGFWQGNCLMVQDASGRVKNLGIMKRTCGSSEESSEDDESESSQQWLNQARERLKKE